MGRAAQRLKGQSKKKTAERGDLFFNNYDVIIQVDLIVNDRANCSVYINDVYSHEENLSRDIHSWTNGPWLKKDDAEYII